VPAAGVLAGSSAIFRAVRGGVNIISGERVGERRQIPAEP